MIGNETNIPYKKLKIREPIVDGIFYPDNNLLLRKKIKLLIEKSGIEPGNSLGIISPHAALDFSGEF